MIRKPGFPHGLARRTWVAVMYAALVTTAVAEKSRDMFQPNSVPLAREECPTNCDVLFGKLVDNPDRGGGKVQHVTMDERGEPKSGTNVMYEWATGALGHSCIYLQKAYGPESCRIEWEFSSRTLVFEPSLALNGQEIPPCRCDGVDRVTISISNAGKHYVPVEQGCAYEHKAKDKRGQEHECAPSDGDKLPTSSDELWDCMVEASCKPVDKSLQLAIMRDPRAVVVSAYFHLARLQGETFVHENPSVDHFALALLPAKVQRICLRYFFFTRILKERAIVLWYEDAIDDPLDWHSRFLTFVGLNMPPDLVSEAARVSVEGGSILGFRANGFNEHPGGENAQQGRTFKDEIRYDTLEEMDNIMRAWLHPSILEKFDIPS